jgi:N-acetylglucosamine-6-phosphate deacetylase
LAHNKGSYFDLQVNGYGGVDFNSDTLTADELNAACQRMAADGVGGFLATIITEHIDTMRSRLSNLARLRAASPIARQMIYGFHIEGPFISPEVGYRGAHPADAIIPADVDTMKYLLDAADGLTRLVTLAPEVDTDLALTKMLTDAGVVVSAGHCNPSYDQLAAAADAGLSMFTHLGNGCPMLLDRHDNIVQRVLSLSERLWICFIVDGVHIPFAALGNYIRAAGAQRCIAVTDAIAPAGLGPGRFTLSRWDLEIGDDMVARAPDGSHLVGSATTMPLIESHLQESCGLSRLQAATLTMYNPRRALGLKTTSYPNEPLLTLAPDSRSIAS